jgi:hypothetical protein
LVPQQYSSDGKKREGGISKQGNPYLRRLLVVGATAVIRQAGYRLAATPSGAWARSLLERRPARLASGGVGQQDCAHWLGTAGEGGSLSPHCAGPGRLGGAQNETQRTTQRYREGEHGVMANRSNRGRTNPQCLTRGFGATN